MSQAADDSIQCLYLILGDQLFPLDGQPLAGFDLERDVVLMIETEGESTHVPSHRQRSALFLSAMRHYANELREAGHRVRYVRLDDPSNTQDLGGEVRRAIGELNPGMVRFTRPGEWRVLDAIREALDDAGDAVDVEMAEDEHFLLPIDEFRDWADGRRELVMEHFYRMMRRRLDVLMGADGKPMGGAWNFDKDNREPFRGALDELPPRLTFEPDTVTRDVLATIEQRLPDNPGKLDEFAWPVTRTQALEVLEHFLEHRLPDFGRYQDAMVTGQPWMYHSLLSPLLNLKLLDPREVVEGAVLKYAEGAAPISSVEGFVRQVIGWREFVRGIYWTEGRDYVERNELEQEGALPEFYWTGDTQMNCMSQCIGEVLDHGFGHHIQRLMVTGNFALMAGVDPREISDWYLAMYVDAVDWVTLPNTLGMVMHADGGRVGTKPYASTGKYIDRMSDYCKRCRFDPKKRYGETACPFTTLYWDFLDRNRDRFGGNRRMAFAMRNLERISDEEMQKIRERGLALRSDYGIVESAAEAEERS